MEKHQIDKKMGPPNYIRHLRWNFPLEKTWQMSIFKRTHCQFLWISVRFFKIKTDQNSQKLTLWRRENTHEKRAQKQKESTNFSKNETYVKVIKFHEQIKMFSFLPKNERNPFFWFCPSFYGTIISFVFWKIWEQGSFLLRFCDV